MTKEQALKEKYANRRKEWLAENGFNENGVTWIYAKADSYEKKEELKDAGFRFSSYLLWHAATVPLGYEESCLEVHLDQVAELGAWGEGFYKPGTRTIVNNLLSSVRPPQPASEWIGEEKEKISNLPVTLVGIRGFQGAYGYSKVVNFVTEEGNKITWFTATDIQFNQGDTLLLSATIKKLDTYNGVKSTIVTRAKLKAVQVSAFDFN